MAIGITTVPHASPAVASATNNQPAAKSQTPNTKSQSQSSTSATADTVRISNAAKAALQEATETRFQTAQEAGKGDLQAQKLLAKETAVQHK